MVAIATLLQILGGTFVVLSGSLYLADVSEECAQPVMDRAKHAKSMGGTEAERFLVVLFRRPGVLECGFPWFASLKGFCKPLGLNLADRLVAFGAT